MQKNRKCYSCRLTLCALVCILFATVFNVVPAFSKEDNVVDIKMRELSVQDSMKSLIEQNRSLKAEKDDLLSSVSRMEASQAMLNNRIRGLTSSIDALNRESQAQKDEFNRQLDVHIKEAEVLKKEIEEIDAQRDVLSKKLSDKKHYRYWQDTLKELRENKKHLLSLANEKEQLVIENAKMHYNLGILFFEKGDYEKAAYEFETALKYLPNDADIYYNLALIFDYYIIDSKKANEYYKKYVDLSKDKSTHLRVRERIADNTLRSRIRK
jgi:tetratricopeptide (TPR) repeat protein